MGLNRVVLTGRLTKDPDLKYTQSGVAVCNFTVAVDRPFKTNGQNEADFINCVVWRKPAENLANYMSKGSMIGADGRLQTRTYQNQNDQTVFVTEVVADSVQFLESKNKQQNNQSNENGPLSRAENPPKSEAEPMDISDEDLPF